MQDAIKAEEALAQSAVDSTAAPPSASCPGCGRPVANLGEALKAHAWAKHACRAYIPAWMRDAIEAEAAVASAEQRGACLGCGRVVANLQEALKAHA